MGQCHFCINEGYNRQAPNKDTAANGPLLQNTNLRLNLAAALLVMANMAVNRSLTSYTMCLRLELTLSLCAVRWSVMTQDTNLRANATSSSNSCRYGATLAEGRLTG